MTSCHTISPVQQKEVYNGAYNRNHKKYFFGPGLPARADVCGESAKQKGCAAGYGEKSLTI